MSSKVKSLCLSIDRDLDSMQTWLRSGYGGGSVFNGGGKIVREDGGRR